MTFDQAFPLAILGEMSVGRGDSEPVLVSCLQEGQQQCSGFHVVELEMPTA